MSEDGYPLPAPNPTGLNADWYAFCAEGELRFQQCMDCARNRHPPRFLCPQCGSDRWSWQRSSALGKIYSWTVTHKPLHPSFAGHTPYVVAVVELEEGPRIVCSLREIAIESLRLDLPVEIGFAPASADVALPFAHPRDHD